MARVVSLDSLQVQIGKLEARITKGKEAEAELPELQQKLKDMNSPEFKAQKVALVLKKRAELDRLIASMEDLEKEETEAEVKVEV